MIALVEEVQKLGIKSIAIPPLGCGNGGLNWVEVKAIIEKALAQLSDIQVVVFEPTGTLTANKMQVNTSKPKMTLSRSLFIHLIDVYSVLRDRLTKIEIQKLVYFLTVAGEPDLQKLRYVKHQFGPYADNLNHALQRIEGHYIRGYGDRTRNSHTQIYVLPEGKDKAKAFLANYPDANERLQRVSHLISGFETPYGLEMLATIHWVVMEDPQAAVDCERAILGVQQWSDRKQRIFKPSHLKKAWQRLKEQNWLTC